VILDSLGHVCVFHTSRQYYRRPQHIRQSEQLPPGADERRLLDRVSNRFKHDNTKYTGTEKTADGKDNQVTFEEFIDGYQDFCEDQGMTDGQMTR
jgi:hypothetical protein